MLSSTQMSTTERVHLCSYLTKKDAIVSSPPPPLFICRNRSTTATEARTRVLALAQALSALVHAEIGHRICTLAQTTPAHLELLLAVTAAGCIAAPLNWRWSSREVAYAVNHIEASILCVDAASLPLALQLLPACPHLTALLLINDDDDDDDDILAVAETTCPIKIKILQTEHLIASSHHTRNLSTSSPLLLQQPKDGAAFIIFTSGTTGPPRAALLSHAALHFQCGAKLHYCGYSSTDTYLHTAQLFHVGGLCSALAMLRCGAQHVFLPLFRPIPCLELIQRYRITSFIAVPTMISDLVAAAAGAAGRRTFPSVRSVLIGAGGVSPSLAASLATLLPTATIYSAYGMTEACSSLTFCTLRSSSNNTEIIKKEKETTIISYVGAVAVGAPPPGIQLGIVLNSPTTTNTNVIQGEGFGEVVTRGPHLMLRYWNESAAAAFLPHGGWFRTGDLGHLTDQGCLWLVGRVKDVIKSGGENVAAAEVERVLQQHPGVAAAAVVGLPDARLGERVAAAVVVAPGWTWSDTEDKMDDDDGGGVVSGGLLQQHCRSAGLSGFKLPRTVVAMEELPRNATGKVLKPQVRSMLLEKLATAPPPPPLLLSKL